MRVHLLSMPAYIPYFTSIQTGALKAYIDQKFKDDKRVSTYTYTAHLSVPLRAFQVGYIDIDDKYNSCWELIWFTIFLKAFNPFGVKDVNKDVKSLIDKITKYSKQRTAASDIKKLEKAIVAFIEQDLVPNLSEKELNIVGFSLNFDQVYGSLFCYSYLKKHYPDRKVLFVFGGGLVPYSAVLKVFKNLKVDGLAVIGEGELKLEHIINTFLNSKDLDVDSLEEKGIYKISNLSDEKIKDIHPKKEMQLSSIEELPVPDYDEFFEIIKKYSYDEEVYAYLKNEVMLLIEGSRGCSYNRCAFCALSMCWCNYRYKSPQRIYEQITELLSRYALDKLQFTDNSTDVWVRDFADILLKNKMSLNGAFYELRATHDEAFLARVALTGCKNAQIGIEALSESLLIKMNKGAKLIDNLRTLKYLRELDMAKAGSSNLIVYYPTSTISEIKETKAILKLIPHFGKLNTSKYRHEECSKNELELKIDRSDKSLWDNCYGIPERFYEYVYLEGMRLKHLPKKEVAKAWADFLAWYKKLNLENDHLYVIRLAKNKIVIKEHRLGLIAEHIYEGEYERIYTLCHKGVGKEDIVKELSISETIVDRILKEFVRKGLVVKASEKYLSLGLRPKEELVISTLKSYLVS